MKNRKDFEKVDSFSGSSAIYETEKNSTHDKSANIEIRRTLGIRQDGGGQSKRSYDRRADPGNTELVVIPHTTMVR